MNDSSFLPKRFPFLSRFFFCRNRLRDNGALAKSEVECRENRESPWKASGFGIARKKAHYWVVVNENDVYVADVKNIVKMLKKNRGDLDDHVSRRNLDDYEKRMYARGHLVPLQYLESCCHVICASPVKSPEV